MGIQGLLPMLKEISVHGEISDFKGKRLAVDAYVWLHKGAFGCAEQLVKGERTTKFVDYAMHRVRMLRYHGITPYIVFDGGPLPAKKGTEVARAKSRAEYKARARALESQGRKKEARDCYTKCLDVTPEMAFQFIKALRAENVDYVVAPYEADAQLCFLEREGYVDGIITEDSDLLVFGCRQVIFKLEKDGKCVSINRDHFDTLVEFPMHGWSDLQFRRMAMLSGCDYLPSISGIGIKKAHKLLRRYKTVEKVLQSIRMEGVMDVPADYHASFSQAELAFIFQRVYDPAQRRLVPLNEFPAEGLREEDQKWVGLDVNVVVARGMARGDLHPETREPIEDLWPSFKPEPRGATRTPTPAKAVSGPLDGYFSRVSAPLPRPLGQRTSGPSKLSDVRQGSTTSTAVPVFRSTAKSLATTSKHFGRRSSASQDLEAAVAKIKQEAVWERSDGADHCEANNPTSRATTIAATRPSAAVQELEEARAEAARPAKWELSDGPNVESQEPETFGHAKRSSPSPSVQSLPSPPRTVSSPHCSSPALTDEDHHLTSPCNSVASPPLALKVDGATIDRPSRRPGFGAHRRERDQESPTPLAKRRRTSRESPQRSSGSSTPDVVADTPTRSTAAVVSTSSDGPMDDELVTPSLEMGRSFRSQQHAEDEIEDVDDPDEAVQREAQRDDRKRLAAIADGWKRKYAYNPAVVFPKPRSTRTVRAVDKDGRPRDIVFSPPPSRTASTNVLVEREVNVATAAGGPEKRDVSKQGTLIFSALQRFSYSKR